MKSEFEIIDVGPNLDKLAAKLNEYDYPPQFEVFQVIVSSVDSMGNPSFSIVVKHNKSYDGRR